MPKIPLLWLIVAVISGLSHLYIKFIIKIERKKSILHSIVTYITVLIFIFFVYLSLFFPVLGDTFIDILLFKIIGSLIFVFLFFNLLKSTINIIKSFLSGSEKVKGKLKSLFIVPVDDGSDTYSLGVSIEGKDTKYETSKKIFFELVEKLLNKDPDFVKDDVLIVEGEPEIEFFSYPGHFYAEDIKFIDEI